MYSFGIEGVNGNRWRVELDTCQWELPIIFVYLKFDKTILRFSMILSKCLNIRPMILTSNNLINIMCNLELIKTVTVSIFFCLYLNGCLHLTIVWIDFFFNSQSISVRKDDGSWEPPYILVMIFKYSRALRAALVWAPFDVLPDPWQTATGNVDNWTRHWKCPE